MSKKALFALAATVCVVAAPIAVPQAAAAAPLAQTTVDRGNGVMVYREMPLVMKSKAGTAQRQINAIRGKAWDENVRIEFSWFEGVQLKKGVMPVRDAAKRVGLKTRDQYVKNIYWDNTLEDAVILRAAEENDNRMDHERPNSLELMGDTTIFGVPFYGGENLTSAPMAEAVGSWSTSGSPSEWAQLISAQGAWTNGNGHLQNMLNPSNKYFAQAQVGGVTAQILTADPASKYGRKPSKQLPDSTYTFATALSRTHSNEMRLSAKKTSTVGASGGLSVYRDTSAGRWDVGVKRFTSSNPQVMSVSDRTYRAVAPGTLRLRAFPNELRNNQLVEGNAIYWDLAVQAASKPSSSVKPKPQDPSEPVAPGTGANEGSSDAAIGGIVAAVLALLSLLGIIAKNFNGVTIRF